MGRHSGFIACYAALANHDVDFVLVPEVPFTLDGDDGCCAHAARRVAGRATPWSSWPRARDRTCCAHDGAARRLGQRCGSPTSASCCATGSPTDFDRAGQELSLRYVDPGYAIRSVPANAYDAVYCIRLAQAAVHAAMAGRTAMVVGRWHGRFVHLPISLATGSRNQVDPDGDLWMSVLEATGQPLRFG